MELTAEQIRTYRLWAHHLDGGACDILSAAGACGLQNSPPGAWETAMFNRVEGCTLEALHRALYEEKTLLQAWSYRGVPVVFPTEDSGIFLSPLSSQPGESPWIYTRGITLALDHLQMTFEGLLLMVMEAALALDNCTIQSKEALDSFLAGILSDKLPDPWNDPSMYGSPDRQTVGGAVVSFLLRPCSFAGLVVFGRRQGISPTFTSFKNWIGRPFVPNPEGERALVRKFLHCYGPANVNAFAGWLGACPKQARRMWSTASAEMTPVSVDGKTAYMLTEDMPRLLAPGEGEGRLLLLGAHDPYLDIKDRAVLLPDTSLHKVVWKTVGNPNVILRDGLVIGIWKTKTVKENLEISMTIFEPIRAGEKAHLSCLAEKYAVFRHLKLKKCSIQTKDMI